MMKTNGILCENSLRGDLLGLHVVKSALGWNILPYPQFHFRNFIFNLHAVRATRLNFAKIFLCGNFLLRLKTKEIWNQCKLAASISLRFLHHSTNTWIPDSEIHNIRWIMQFPFSYVYFSVGSFVDKWTFFPPTQITHSELSIQANERTNEWVNEREKKENLFSIIFHKFIVGDCATSRFVSLSSPTPCARFLPFW